MTPFVFFTRIIVWNEEEDSYLVLHNIGEDSINPELPRNRFEFPGGKREEGELFLAAGLRELEEETGLKVRNPQYFTSYRWIVQRAVHVGDHECVGDFIQIKSQFLEGYPARIIEPHKFKEVRWVTVEEYSKLPQIPFLGIDVLRIARAANSTRLSLYV